jgi:hypothetical protein
VITPRRLRNMDGQPIRGSAPTRMRPTRWAPNDDAGTLSPRACVGVETRNGLPVGHYRWRRPVPPCAIGALPCGRCELARGCGGLFDRRHNGDC